MNTEIILALFTEMLRLECLAQSETFDGQDYFAQSCGAYKMLTVLGLTTQYTEWSNGKEYKHGKIINIEY